MKLHCANWLVALALLTVPGTPLFAQSVYVVDDDGGPGVDFQDIQSAIDVASPLDRIDVLPGDYAGFVWTTPTTVMGRPAGTLPAGRVVVNAPILMDGIVGPIPAVMTDLSYPSIHAVNCSATLLFDGIREGKAMRVVGCHDVRLRGCTLFDVWLTGLTVEASRVQLVQCSIGETSWPGGMDAVRLFAGSELSVFDSVLEGSNGFDTNDCLGGVGGDGGSGLFARGGSNSVIVRSVLKAGATGLACGQPNGLDGFTLIAIGGTHVVSESDVAGPVLTNGGTLREVPDLPMLRIDPASVGTGLAVLEAFAGAGSSGRILAGRSPETVAVGGSFVPRLVTVGRLSSTGPMPAIGQQRLSFSSASLPRGTRIHLQTSATDAAGTQMSNASDWIAR